MEMIPESRIDPLAASCHRVRWPLHWSEPEAWRFRRPLAWPEPHPSRRLRFHAVPNLWEVAAGCLYLSGHPEADEDYRALFAAGMRGIINLCAEPSLRLQLRGWRNRQRFRYHPVPPVRLSSPPQALHFLQIVADPDNLPLLVHSGSGGGRAAMLVALARYSIDGWSPQECLAEVARFGGSRLPFSRSRRA